LAWKKPFDLTLMLDLSARRGESLVACSAAPTNLRTSDDHVRVGARSLKGLAQEITPFEVI
jgi:hypothetical protein